MVKCAVSKCKSDSRKHTKKKNDISFHRFPKCCDMAKKWVAAIKRPNWEPNIRSFVCSVHFAASKIFETKSGLRKLVEGAIPELYLDGQVKEESMTSPATEIKVVPSTSKVLPTSVYASDSSEMPSTSKNVGTPTTNKTIKVPSKDEKSYFFTPEPNDTPRKRKLKREIIKLTDIAKRRRLRCNALYTQRNRLKKKITSLSQMLKELREKQLITQEHNDILEICGPSAAELFQRMCHKGKQYSPGLRSFALTLNFYSPKAYDYVRSTFNTCLPHASTIRKWYSSINASPGFTEEAFRVLKEKTKTAEKKVFCSLVFDEMSIRQLEEFDGKRVYGYVDFGGEMTGDINQIATQALVFLLVGINENFKLPVGYFFVSGVSSEQKANLLNICLANCHEANIEVVSVTFDGCPSNIAMSKLLGCCFDNIENFKTSFPHPITGQEVMIFLDPCHMVKLVRNTLESKKIFKNRDNDQIKWQHLVDLHDLQEKETFHFANKLTSRHILFQEQKMKVKLAVQLFSNRVANALEFCNQELYLPSCENCEATVEFIRIMNNLFDVLNSHKFPNIDFKEPISEKNKNKYFNFLDSTFEYLQELTFLDDKKIVMTRNKVGFLGLCICVASMKALYLRLVEKEKSLKFIPMYKISQDHVELLFSAIRSHGGFNNNPSALQFTAIYKKLLCHMELRKSTKGNCFPLENITLLHCSSSADHINLTTKGYRSEMDESFRDMADWQFMADGENNLELPETFLSEPSKQVISYIAGYVVRYLLEKLVCETCKKALISKEKSHQHKFIVLKDRGGLQYPSNDVIDICMQTETVIRKTVSPKKNSNLMALSLVTETLQLFIGKDIFTILHEHIFHQTPCSNHLIHLLRAVIQKYVDIRMTYLVRKTGIKHTKRQLYNKLTLFQGQ